MAALKQFAMLRYVIRTHAANTRLSTRTDIICKCDRYNTALTHQENKTKINLNPLL